jgi:hypothetical protein
MSSLSCGEPTIASTACAIRRLSNRAPTLKQRGPPPPLSRMDGVLNMMPCGRPKSLLKEGTGTSPRVLLGEVSGHEFGASPLVQRAANGGAGGQAVLGTGKERKHACISTRKSMTPPGAISINLL